MDKEDVIHTHTHTHRNNYIYIHTHTHTHTHTMEYYSAIKKNEMLPFAPTWMDLESITLSEIRQRKTNTA